MAGRRLIIPGQAGHRPKMEACHAKTLLWPGKNQGFSNQTSISPPWLVKTPDPLGTACLCRAPAGAARDLPAQIRAEAKQLMKLFRLAVFQLEDFCLRLAGDFRNQGNIQIFLEHA